MRAREVGYLKMADEMLEIADDSTRDYVERQNKDGSTYKAVDHDHIARARLRVDTRKWLLAKALPKIFGDKPAVEQPPVEGGALQAVEGPRSTGEDHLAALAKRYANGLKLIEGSAPQRSFDAARPPAPTTVGDRHD